MGWAGLALVLALGCSAPAGGAATGPLTQQAANKVGSNCSPLNDAEACTPQSGAVNGIRVKCAALPNDPTLGTWEKLEECGADKVCKEDKVDASKPQKVSMCVDKPADTPDTISGGDGTTTGGDGTTSGGDGATTKDIQFRKPSDMMACAQKECAKELAACNAAPECKKLIDCANTCSDGKCVQEKCEPKNPTDPTIAAIGMCMYQKECTAKVVCGDGDCNPFKEDQQKCPADCAPKTKCGDGMCQSEKGENPSTCPQDCKADVTCNGNGTCDPGETPSNCPIDCKVTTSCGNKKCETDKGENKSTCPQDCSDINPPACNNNGFCETPNENPENCPKDCKVASSCGNKTCEPAKGETSSTCPQDCPPSTTGGCGDLMCKSPESASTCAIDCGSKYASFAACTKEMCNSETVACAANKNCMKGLECLGICGCTNESCLLECAGSAMSDSQAQALGQALSKCSQSKKCPNPCGSTSVCNNNGTCEASKGETPSNCADCQDGPPCNMNGKCESGEDPSCPDCKVQPTCNNNGTCEAAKGETSSNCPKDCPMTGHPCDTNCGKSVSALGCYCDAACMDPNNKDCCTDNKGTKGPTCAGSTCGECNGSSPPPP